MWLISLYDLLNLTSIACYGCKTNKDHDDDFCGDPFNISHPLLEAISCEKTDYCTKWVVELPSGELFIIRGMLWPVSHYDQ